MILTRGQVKERGCEMPEDEAEANHGLPLAVNAPGTQSHGSGFTANLYLRRISDVRRNSQEEQLAGLR